MTPPFQNIEVVVFLASELKVSFKIFVELRDGAELDDDLALFEPKISLAIDLTRLLTLVLADEEGGNDDD